MSQHCFNLLSTFATLNVLNIDITTRIYGLTCRFINHTTWFKSDFNVWVASNHRSFYFVIFFYLWWCYNVFLPCYYRNEIKPCSSRWAYHSQKSVRDFCDFENHSDFVISQKVYEIISSYMPLESTSSYTSLNKTRF